MKSTLTHEKIVMERRLEAEKRESWLKVEKLDLLEVEKTSLLRQLKVKEDNLSNAARRLETTQAQLERALIECESLREDAQTSRRQLVEAQQLLDSRKGLEAELSSVREVLAVEQAYSSQLLSQLDSAGVLETPRISDRTTTSSSRSVQAFGSHNSAVSFGSVDSSSTTVDTDSSLKEPFTLKAVEEEGSDLSTDSDEDQDELASYEDEDEMDFGVTSPHSTSSYGSGSDDEFPRSLSHLRLAGNATPVPGSGNVSSTSSTPSPTSSPCPTPIPHLEPEVVDVRHIKNASLSKTWTFPRNGRKGMHPAEEEVDHFFGCLEDINVSSVQQSCTPTNDRSLFSQRLQFGGVDDENFPPFILPAQQRNSIAEDLLAVVVEEDEDEMEKDDCDTPDGKTLTFPMSVSENDSLCASSLPVFADERSSSSVPFTFPQMRSQRNNDTSVRSMTLKATTDDLSASTIPSRKAVPALASSPSLDSLRMSSTRPFLPSRIPPPSPPTFVQAKPPSSRVSFTPSPPKRKPVPPPSSTSPRTVRTPTMTTKGTGSSSPQSYHGSTLIPQLKTLSTLTYFPFCCSRCEYFILQVRAQEVVTSFANKPTKSTMEQITTDII
jgi:hypothetical protein